MRGLDPFHLGEAKLDPVVKLRSARPHEPRRVGQPERNEQQPRLIHVAVVAVDHGDLRRIAVALAKAVRGERTAGTATKDQNPRTHTSIVEPVWLRAIRATAYVLRSGSGKCSGLITDARTGHRNEHPASVVVESITGARLSRRGGSVPSWVLVLGAAGVVAVVWTAWTGVHSPVLVDPGAVGLWRAAIVAAYWAVGTYTWWRRPESRLGPVVTGVGLVYAATSLAGSAEPLVHTLGMVTWTAGIVCTAYMYLCFPTGGLESRLERTFMLAVVIGTAAVWGLLLAVSASLPAGGSFVNCGHGCPPNALQVVSGEALARALATAVRVLFTFAAIGSRRCCSPRRDPRLGCAAARSPRWLLCSSRVWSFS